MFLQILRAHYKIRQPVTRLALQAICEGSPENAEDLHDIYRSLIFFLRLRDLYRLTVAATDELDPTCLDLCAGLMGFEDLTALLYALEGHYRSSNEKIFSVLGRVAGGS